MSRSWIGRSFNNFFQAATFVVASLVGAAVVVAPQGLGVIEATTALLSSLIGLSAGIGFLACCNYANWRLQA
jgi:uncharacterized membrane protein YbhN (UPF0104 family)